MIEKWKSYNQSGVVLMFVSIVAFSIMHAGVKAIPRIEAHQIISFRSLFSILITCYFLYSKKINPWGNHKYLLILRGLTGVVSLFLFFLSIKALPLAIAITVSNTIPFFTLLLASITGHDDVRSKHWLFICISFAGILCIKGFDQRFSWFDLSLALGGAFFAAASHFLVRILSKTEKPEVTMFYFPLVSLVFVLPYTVLHWTAPTDTEWLWLILIGITTHVGQVFLTRAYTQAGVPQIASVYFVGILLSVFWGFLLFDEQFSWLTMFGMFLVMLGVYLNAKNTISKKG